jgi:UDP-N-acetylglucosamine 2-epimerase (non-hydrolysing)
MKIAPFIHEIQDYNLKNENKIQHILVHTGQHYDDRMSKSFFESLAIPAADINLGIGSGSHAEQVGNTMIEFEKILLIEKPDWVIVLGDVNATLACSITAKKLQIKVCHIEAGLRSGDMGMPEEINRLVTDRLSDLLLTPDKISTENLIKEGTESNRIVFVGNIMIDTLENNKEFASSLLISDIIKNNLKVKSEINTFETDFVLLTLHRPSNVDDPKTLTEIVNFLVNEVSAKHPIIWAIHPRTEKQLKVFSLWDTLVENKNIVLLHPLGYHEMLRLNMSAKVVLTDSGGLQEECTILGTPCLTMRWNTERPVTLVQNGGLSVLVGNNLEKIRTEFNNSLVKLKTPIYPELWDGKTAQRCLNSILNYI